MQKTEIIERALKTFLQAVLGYIMALSFTDIDWSNKQVVIGLVASALSAGLSALMNIDWTASRQSETEGGEDE